MYLKGVNIGNEFESARNATRRFVPHEEESGLYAFAMFSVISIIRIAHPVKTEGIDVLWYGRGKPCKRVGGRQLPLR